MKNPAEKAEQYAAPIADDYTADRTRSSWKQVYEDLCFAHLAGQKCALESAEVKGLLEALDLTSVKPTQDEFEMYFDQQVAIKALAQFEKARLK